MSSAGGSIVQSGRNHKIHDKHRHDETHKKYPFNFKLIIKYTLEEDCLTVTYKVKNRSLKDDMYYGIGGHPAFNVSQTTNEAGNEEFNQVYFRFEPNHEQLYIPLSKEGLLKLKEAKTQKVNEIQLTHETFKEDALIYKIKPNSVMILTDKANRKSLKSTRNESCRYLVSLSKTRRFCLFRTLGRCGRR